MFGCFAPLMHLIRVSPPCLSAPFAATWKGFLRSFCRKNSMVSAVVVANVVLYDPPAPFLLFRSDDSAGCFLVTCLCLLQVKIVNRPFLFWNLRIFLVANLTHLRSTSTKLEAQIELHLDNRDFWANLLQLDNTFALTCPHIHKFRYIFSKSTSFCKHNFEKKISPTSLCPFTDGWPYGYEERLEKTYSQAGADLLHTKSLIWMSVTSLKRRITELSRFMS